MSRDKISIKNVKGVSSLSVEFDFPKSNILVVTGKNGVGKTSIIKAFHLLKEPNIFEKSSGLNSIRTDSEIVFNLDGFAEFSFNVNERRGVLDTRDKIPSTNEIIAELPIPFGDRFKSFSLIASFDGEIRNSIASGQYSEAEGLINFLSEVYCTDKFNDLKEVKVGKHTFYFLLRQNDYYVREDHLSSGEFFLIQIYRLITSGARLILVDELDVALDAAAQVRLYAAIKSILEVNGARMIVISHSLALMNTVDDGGLYYLEKNQGEISLEQRSFGYIKSDLYGFKGFERYILTEDPVLEGFIEFMISYFSITPYYMHKTIGVGGVNQLRSLVEKNDIENIFSSSNNVIAISDADTFTQLRKGYTGSTRLLHSPVEDLELYIYSNRDFLFPNENKPPYKEKKSPKEASKKYWEYLTKDLSINQNYLYKLIAENNADETLNFAEEIQDFIKIRRN